MKLDQAKEVADSRERAVKAIITWFLRNIVRNCRQYSRNAMTEALIV
jgi:hypothetical protein